MRVRSITVTESRPRHRLAFATLALGMGMLAALVIAEIALRSSGHKPWKEFDGHLDMPRMHEPDPDLGWRSKEGRYVFGTTPIHMTFWPDHTRATAAAPVRADAAVVVLGCSFVQGWALSDEETFAWKLQERFARARVLNFGTAGYGTTQSLLALERYLEERKRTHGAAAAKGPLIVVYGFSDFHASRSIAEASWLKTLAQGSRGQGATPYATLGGDGELQLHPPKTYPAWWLHRRLATVATLEELWASFDAMKRTSQANAVTRSCCSSSTRSCGRAGESCSWHCSRNSVPEAWRRSARYSRSTAYPRRNACIRECGRRRCRCRSTVIPTPRSTPTGPAASRRPLAAWSPNSPAAARKAVHPYAAPAPSRLATRRGRWHR